MLARRATVLSNESKLHVFMWLAIQRSWLRFPVRSAGYLGEQHQTIDETDRDYANDYKCTTLRSWAKKYASAPHHWCFVIISTTHNNSCAVGHKGQVDRETGPWFLIAKAGKWVVNKKPEIWEAKSFAT